MVSVFHTRTLSLTLVILCCWQIFIGRSRFLFLFSPPFLMLPSFQNILHYFFSISCIARRFVKIGSNQCSFCWNVAQQWLCHYCNFKSIPVIITFTLEKREQVFCCTVSKNSYRHLILHLFIWDFYQFSLIFLKYRKIVSIKFEMISIFQFSWIPSCNFKTDIFTNPYINPWFKNFEVELLKKCLLLVLKQ